MIDAWFTFFAPCPLLGKVDTERPLRMALLSVAIGLGLAAFAGSHGEAQEPTKIHVAPDGDDQTDGTAAEPFATLHRAATELARHHEIGTESDIEVILHDGRYQIEEPLTIGVGHLPRGGHRVVFRAAPGATPIISGGRTITGWTRDPSGTLSVQLDDVAKGKWSFRELFVNGQRRPRARHPNEGFLRIDEAFADKRTGFTFRSGDLPTAVIDGAELVFLHDWSISRIRILSVDHKQRRLTLSANIGNQAKHYEIDYFEKHPRYFIEDHRALLDAPGEWYLDRQAGRLTYDPMPGESVDNIRVIAPRAPALLIVRGTADQPVRNVHFQGLTFAHAAWPLPPGGYASGQASVHERRDFSDQHSTRKMMESALRFERAEDCSFVDGRITQIGMSGIAFGSRTRRCRLGGNVIEDISGNSVNLGEDTSRRVGPSPWWQAAPDQVASDHTVANNLIQQGGRQFYGSVAVWVGLARHMRITHNLIRQHPYTGVSLGWMWNPKPTPAGHHQVEYNHIHHVMQTLSDGGGIYTLGRQPGTSLSHNHIHDVPLNAGRAESNGMFLDEGTDQITIEDNVIYGIDRSPLRFHRAEDNVVKNNVLVIPDANTPPIRYNRTAPETIHQRGNTVVEAASFDPGMAKRQIDAAGIPP